MYCIDYSLIGTYAGYVLIGLALILFGMVIAGWRPFGRS